MAAICRSNFVAPFPTSTDYFPSDRRWILNLRVCDLNALLAELGATGIAIVTKPEWDAPDISRFARLNDREGNPIELSEPPADS